MVPPTLVKSLCALGEKAIRKCRTGRQRGVLWVGKLPAQSSWQAFQYTHCTSSTYKLSSWQVFCSWVCIENGLGCKCIEQWSGIKALGLWGLLLPLSAYWVMWRLTVPVVGKLRVTDVWTLQSSDMGSAGVCGQCPCGLITASGKHPAQVPGHM